MAFESLNLSEISQSKQAISQLRAEVVTAYDNIENNDHLSEAGKEAEQLKVYQNAKAEFDRHLQAIEDNKDMARRGYYNEVTRHPSEVYGTASSKENTAEMRSLIEKAEEVYYGGATKRGELERMINRAINTKDQALIRALGYVAYEDINKDLLSRLAPYSQAIKNLYEFEVEYGIFRSASVKVSEKIALTGLCKPPRVSPKNLY